MPVVEVGNKIAVESGAAIFPADDGTITVKLPSGPFGDYLIVFALVSDDSGEHSASVGIDPDRSNAGRITIKNTGNALGGGPTEGFEVATTANKRLFVDFRVYKVEDLPKHIVYTFWVADK